MAIKLHLTTDRYDVFDSDGRVSGTLATFEKRNDRFLFYKLGQKFKRPRELIEYCVANIGYGNKNVIYSNESDENYETWLKRKQSRAYTFRSQLNFLQTIMEDENKSWEDLIRIEDSVPPLLKMYLGGYLHLETIIILDDFENFLHTWEPLILLWGDQLRILKKIKKFVKYDKLVLQSIYYEEFKEDVLKD